MATHHVIKLFNTIEYDYDLREKIYECNGSNELMSMLNSIGYYFDNDDIDNALNMMHIQCKTLEQAENLFHKADWLRYLITH